MVWLFTGAASLMLIALLMALYQQQAARRAACVEQYRQILNSVTSRYPPLSTSLESGYTAFEPAKRAGPYVCYRWPHAELHFSLTEDTVLELAKGSCRFSLNDPMGAAALHRILADHFAQPESMPMRAMQEFGPHVVFSLE